MSGPLFVITSAQIDANPPDVDIILTTDLMVTLSLAWADRRPAHRVRYKRFRGLNIECGVTWDWPPSDCILQAEPGPSTTHTFTLLGAANLADPYFAVSTTCPPAPSDPTSPPLPLAAWLHPRIDAQEFLATPVDPFAAFDLSFTTTPTTILWPPPSLPFTQFLPPQSLPYRALGEIWPGTTVPGTATLSLVDNTTSAILLTKTQVMSPSPATSQLFIAGTVPLTAGHAYAYHFTNNTAGVVSFRQGANFSWEGFFGEP